jgi:hypothetical protein
MTQLVPCPGCDRHVRASDPACPFCACALPDTASTTAAPAAPPRPRMSRAALFAAGATMVGAAACSSSATGGPADGASDAAAHADGGGGTGGSHPDGAAGAGGADAGSDASVAIYSAVFPPLEPLPTRIASAPIKTRSGRTAGRRSR